MDENKNNNGASMNGDERSELMKQIDALNADKQAMKQEFVSSTTDEDNVKTIRGRLNEKAPDIIASIINLALYSPSESVRSKNAIWCAEVLLGIKAPNASDDDQFVKLLKDLQKESANKS